MKRDYSALIGKQLDNSYLTILKIDGDLAYCHCSKCGKNKWIRKNSVLSKNKRQKTCGCLQHKPKYDYNSMLGKPIEGSHLTMLEFNGNMAYCRCSACGSEKWLDRYQVMTKAIKSCGCQRHKLKTLAGKQKSSVARYDYDSMINKKIEGSHLTILKIKDKLAYCRCDLCGNNKWLNKYQVATKKVKSCGCQRYDYNALIGKTIAGSNLVILKVNGSKAYCHCNVCGRNKWIQGSYVASKRQTSCGCEQHKEKYDYQSMVGKPIEGSYLVMLKLKGNMAYCHCNKCGSNKWINKYRVVTKLIISCGCAVTDANKRLAISHLSPNNKSGYAGVTRAGKKWCARITVNKMRHYLGCFDSKEDAIAAKKAAEIKYGVVSVKAAGVAYFRTMKKWYAYIGVKGDTKNLGYFDNKEDAIAARKAAEEKYYPHK